MSEKREKKKKRKKEHPNIFAFFQPQKKKFFTLCVYKNKILSVWLPFCSNENFFFTKKKIKYFFYENTGSQMQLKNSWGKISLYIIHDQRWKPTTTTDQKTIKKKKTYNNHLNAYIMEELISYLPSLWNQFPRTRCPYNFLLTFTDLYPSMFCYVPCEFLIISFFFFCKTNN